jgi:hypothetical protein
MSYQIAISSFFKPVLLPMGATRESSFVELEESALHVRFGFLFDQRIALSEIQSAEPIDWPVLAGIGWRTNFRGTIGLIGTTKGVVRIRLKEPRRIFFLLMPLKLRDLCVSLEEPRRFADELGRRLAPPA